jgi:hypothetical protein
MTAWRDVLSGKARGLQPALLRMGLSVASAGYGVAMLGRDWAYRTGLAPREKAPLPVISVGGPLAAAARASRVPPQPWIWLDRRRAQ